MNYKQLITVDHIKEGQEFSTLSKLFASVGLPVYRNELELLKMKLVLKDSLSEFGLTYKKLNSKSFKVVITSL